MGDIFAKSYQENIQLPTIKYSLQQILNENMFLLFVRINRKHIFWCAWIYITLTEAPNIPESTPTNTTIIEGNKVVLPCPATGTPTPEITWFKDGKRITGNELGIMIRSDGSLQLDHAQGEDAGHYVCEATNVAGKQTHGIDLKVFCKLSSYPVVLNLAFRSSNKHLGIST